MADNVNSFLLSNEREMQKQGGVWIKLRVKTERGRFSIKRKDTVYLVEVKSRAEKGKANVEILRELKKIFKTNVQILYGARAHTKVMFIEGITIEQLHEKMSHLVGEHA